MSLHFLLNDLPGFFMAVDDVAMGVLKRLDESHQLVCGDLTLMFNWDFDSDNVTLNGPTSKHPRVVFHDERLFDHVNKIGHPVTEQLVLETLCHIYKRPELYPWAKKTKAS